MAADRVKASGGYVLVYGWLVDLLDAGQFPPGLAGEDLRRASRGGGATVSHSTTD